MAAYSEACELFAARGPSFIRNHGACEFVDCESPDCDSYKLARKCAQMPLAEFAAGLDIEHNELVALTNHMLRVTDESQHHNLAEILTFLAHESRKYDDSYRRPTGRVARIHPQDVASCGSHDCRSNALVRMHKRLCRAYEADTDSFCDLDLVADRDAYRLELYAKIYHFYNLCNTYFPDRESCAAAFYAVEKRNQQGTLPLEPTGVHEDYVVPWLDDDASDEDASDDGASDPLSSVMPERITQEIGRCGNGSCSAALIAVCAKYALMCPADVMSDVCDDAWLAQDEISQILERICPVGGTVFGRGVPSFCADSIELLQRRLIVAIKPAV